MGYAAYGNHSDDRKEAAETKRSGSGGTPENKGKRPAMHPAGPHADPSLTNPDSTPGTGALSDDDQGGEADPSSG